MDDDVDETVDRLCGLLERFVRSAAAQYMRSGG